MMSFPILFYVTKVKTLLFRYMAMFTEMPVSYLSSLSRRRSKMSFWSSTGKAENCTLLRNSFTLISLAAAIRFSLNELSCWYRSASFRYNKQLSVFFTGNSSSPLFILNKKERKLQNTINKHKLLWSINKFQKPPKELWNNKWW